MSPVSAPSVSARHFCARELRARCLNIKIVFVTGEADLDDLKRAVPSRYALRKPGSFPDLFELIDLISRALAYARPCEPARLRRCGGASLDG